MPSTKLTFKRYEKKYLLSASQYSALRQQLDDHIVPDEYFSSTVCSIYYDGDDYHLIRHSIEAPVYKEKLRLRSYNVPDEDGTVFLELKKKFKGIVYKRRVKLTAREAMDYLAGRCPAPRDDQVMREIDWFLKTNDVSAKAFIACEREAYVSKDDPELRVTFDRDIRWRDTELDITAGSHGESLLAPGQVLMELKVPGAAPMWLAHMLSDLEIFPTGFSKYGTCYRNALLDRYISSRL